MALDQALAQRVRDYFSTRGTYEERAMMGVLMFLIDEKMCVGVGPDNLVVRVDPQKRAEFLKKPGCQAMVLADKVLKGFVVVAASVLADESNFSFWMDLGIAQGASQKKA